MRKYYLVSEVASTYITAVDADRDHIKNIYYKNAEIVSAVTELEPKMVNESSVEWYVHVDHKSGKVSATNFDPKDKPRIA